MPEPDWPVAGESEEQGLVRLRATGNLELLQSWSLVLEALAIPSRIADDGASWALIVADVDRQRAEAALAAYDRDRRELAMERPAPAPDQGFSAAGIAFAVIIGAFFYVTGGREGGDPGGWFARGQAAAERILDGEIWRVVTALTLHADTGHVLSNAVAGLVFVTAVGRWLGGGLALFLTLVSGALGNLAVALVYMRQHNSVGASTATFAAVGLLVGLQVVRWMREHRVFGSRRRALSVVAAGLGVFAMLGVGKGTDVLAHLFGLGAGMLLGFTAGRLVRLPVRPGVDLGFAALGGLIVAGAWVWAFS